MGDLALTGGFELAPPYLPLSCPIRSEVDGLAITGPAWDRAAAFLIGLQETSRLFLRRSGNARLEGPAVIFLPTIRQR